MVRRALCWVLLAAQVLPAAVHAKCPADYRLGDVVEEDIVAPATLVVIDAEATEARKQRDVQKVLMQFRHEPNAAAEVETAFRQAFTTTRDSFLDVVESTFNRRKLMNAGVSSPKFRKLVTSFQQTNSMFPLNTNLATIWAKGESDRVLQASLTARLRNAMDRPVRPDALPPEIKLGNMVRLVTVTKANNPESTPVAQLRGRMVARTNILTLAKAKTDLQNSFPASERAVGRYLATLLKPNCEVDVALTERLRAERVDSVWVGERYEAGDIIAARGQIVDRRIQAALAQLQAPATFSPEPVQKDGRRRWLIATAAAGCLILGLGGWHRARRRRMALLPSARVYADQPALTDGPRDEQLIALPAGSAPTLVPIPSGSEDDWRERALYAERRTEQARAIIRKGLIAQLADLMKIKIVRRLISQRETMLDTQERAAAEMAEIDARLEKIQAPLQDRLRAYERRIAELEKELSARGEENRELLKAKIVLARKQLEMERARNDWN